MEDRDRGRRSTSGQATPPALSGLGDMSQNLAHAFGGAMSALRQAAGRAAYIAHDPTPSHMARGDDFALVSRPVDLADAAQVERFLPDILGRALARAWVDRQFWQELMSDPDGLLARHGVHLPADISVATETPPNARPRLVVYQRKSSGRMVRLLYLQLVMVAGK